MLKKTHLLDRGFDRINEKIVEGYNSEFGPGAFPIDKRNKERLGVVCANYDYSLCNASLAWSYKEIAESRVPDVYVVIGKGNGKLSTYLFGDWESPLGVVKVNTDFGKELVRKSDLKNDMEPFIEETSIGNQLPYLQYANRNDLGKVSFVPILVGDCTYEEICSLADAITDINKRICLIISGNFTNYSNEKRPFLSAIKDNIYNLDLKYINFVNNLDSKGLIEFTKRNKLIDRNVFLLGMEILRGLGCKKGNLLNYHTSGDINNYKEEVIGFGSLIF